MPEQPAVIVVDNGSRDGTPALVRSRHPSVTLVALPHNAGAAARNIGVRLARTPLVAFCDDDTWWSPGSLAAASRIMAMRLQLAVLTASILVEPGGAPDSICTEMAQSPLPRPDGLPGTPLLSFLAGASVIRRRAFLGAGGFEDRLLIGGEEELLGTDLVEAGWEMAYQERLEIHHQASPNRDPHLRRRQGIRNALWYWWTRHPLASASRRTAHLARTMPRDRVSLGAIWEAAGGASWVVAHRRAVSPVVAQRLKLLEPAQRGSKARRYVS